MSGILRTTKLFSFNVEGLEDMLEDLTFTSLTNSQVICLLTETMRMMDSKLNIDGFGDFSQIRQKTKIKGRHSQSW